MSIVETAQSGLGSVANGKTYLDSLVNRKILKPQGVKGINGFVFDYEGDTKVDLRSSITDHFAEDNTAIQDHIASHPDRLVLQGYVGELNRAPQEGILGALNSLQNRLTTVPAYLGSYTPGGLAKIQNGLLKAQNTVQQIQQAAARIKNLVAMFNKATPGDTKQKKAFAQLDAMRKSAQIFSVETPYGIWDDMVIESLSFTQPGDTKGLSDIVVTLKQMRFVEILVSKNTGGFGGRAAFQAQSQVDQGKTPGTQAPTSLLYSTFVGQ